MVNQSRRYDKITKRTRENIKRVSLRAKHKSKAGGLTQAGRNYYNKKTGSNLKPPQPGGGPRKRSFCARSAGQMKKFPKAAKNPKSRLRLARKRWKC